jgi:hypothetical protein
MARNRGSLIFGILVGLVVAMFAYRWVSEPPDRSARVREERVVMQARETLRARLQLGESNVIDPLQPDRKIGKVYVYPVEGGWEVSGYYRRANGSPWYPWLMRLDNDEQLVTLKLDGNDRAIQAIAESDPAIEIDE